MKRARSLGIAVVALSSLSAHAGDWADGQRREKQRLRESFGYVPVPGQPGPLNLRRDNGVWEKPSPVSTTRKPQAQLRRGTN